VKLETKENVMEANAHIIAALERLEAAMAKRSGDKLTQKLLQLLGNSSLSWTRTEFARTFPISFSWRDVSISLGHWIRKIGFPLMIYPSRAGIGSGAGSGPAILTQATSN
jgi:hypothetical protein